MARTAAGAALTAQHRSGQLTIRARSLQDFVRLWPLWRGDSQSFRDLVAASVPLVRFHHGLSSSFASAYYQAFRGVEKVPGDAAPRLADPVDVDRLTASLVITGQAMTGRAIAAGASPQAAMQTALVRTSGAVTRQVLEGGRGTLMRSSAADRQTQGWVRVTGGETCAFCAVLASRGPVFAEESADFQAHDHCACFAEPAYAGSEWPGRAREFRDLYDQHAKGTANPINEFRRVLEGRAA